MHHVAIVGAASSIGLRPDHRTGQPQDVNRAPAALRAAAVVERLSAVDLGDVIPPPYRDFERPPGRPRNELEVADYSHSLAKGVASALAERRFVVVLGGDCSTVLGCLLGARLHRIHVEGAVIIGRARADRAQHREHQGKRCDPEDEALGNWVSSRHHDSFGPSLARKE